jgi:hypothetical protein
VEKYRDTCCWNWAHRPFDLQRRGAQILSPVEELVCVFGAIVAKMQQAVTIDDSEGFAIATNTVDRVIVVPQDRASRAARRRA